MGEEDSKAAAGSCLQGAQSRQARVFGTGDFAGGQLPGEVGLSRGMSSGKRALFFRLGSAHGTTDGQDVPQRQKFGIHPVSIHHRRLQYSTSSAAEMVNFARLNFSSRRNRNREGAV